MSSVAECYVDVVLPAQTTFVTARRFTLRSDRQWEAVDTFVYSRRRHQQPDAVELDPLQLRLRVGPFIQGLS